MTERLDYAASCRRLNLDPAPPIPARRPRHDDHEPLGVNFFREIHEGQDHSGLTLPRTFFCRSQFEKCSFRNTDLSESTLCWNDFVEVDFSRANLNGSDLRASIFDRASFDDADLGATDMRQSTFLSCTFDGASMKGATLARRQRQDLSLSEAQIEEIAWVDSDGNEPDGG